MAKKITELTELTSIDGEDLLYAVDDPNGTPASKKIKASNVLTALNAGVSEGARVYNDADISINDSADTPLTFNSERYDTNDIHSTSSNTGRLTCRTAGKYIISGTVEFATNATGVRHLWIYLNGNTDICRQNIPSTHPSGNRITVTTIYDLAVGDYVELYVYQNSTGALNIESAGNRSPEFMMHRLTSTSLGTTEAVRVYNSTSISSNTDEYTLMTFDSESFDTDNIHSTTSNTGRLTCRTAGKYLIGAHGTFQADAVGMRRVIVKINGTTYLSSSDTDALSDGGSSSNLNVNFIYDLAIGDYLELYTYQGAGHALTVNPIFEMHRIGEIDKATPITGWIGADAMTYASADDPTYTMTCSGDKTTVYYAGQRIKLTQSTGGTKYFIVTKVAYSAPDTTLTLYGGTDYNLENEAISSPYYSLVKAPAGFPLDPTKWTVSLVDTSDREQSNPVDTTWYNLGSLSLDIPIGIWNVDYSIPLYGYKNPGLSTNLRCSLSTASNSVSDSHFTAISYSYRNTSANEGSIVSLYRSKCIVLTSKTTYYLIAMSNEGSIGGINFYGSASPTIVHAVCAYL